MGARDRTVRIVEQARAVRLLRLAGDGAGLEGIARRAADAGGELDVRRDGDEFSVTVTVPRAATEVTR